LIVQLIHPADDLSSVSTAQWAFVHYLSIAMDLLALLGVTGLYARQVKKAGWLGLAGYLLFSLFWAISVAFHFTEAVIEPALVAVAPKFVEGAVAMVSGGSSEVSLGSLPVAPFFIMQPAFGLGFAASKTKNPAQARLRSLMNHTAFGLGLYLFAMLVNWLLRFAA